MRRPASGTTRSVLTLLLAVLFTLSGPLSGPSHAASSRPAGGDRNAQVSRHGDHAVASTRLASSRVRTAPLRTELPLGAAVLPTVGTPRTHLTTASVSDSHSIAARSAPRGGTLSRAPPA